MPESLNGNSNLGRTVQVVKVGRGSYELDEEALKSVLMQDGIIDCPVVLISVAGAYRGGKSFLLNFFLKYLNWKYVSSEDDNWTGGENKCLEGFSWRGGSDRDTTGLHLCAHPIKATLPCGTKVAVLLMDTQGAFDSNSTMRDCTTIFALSTMLASVQIYNLKENIREDDLQHLQLFTDYGKMAINNGEKVFQNLKFLVRDWSWYSEYPYGAEGGKQLLDKRLQVHDTQAKELQEIRQQIKSCFQKVDCFLMPHPGFEVLKQEYNGRLADMRSEFKQCLLELVSSIFEPTNLTVKIINDQPVKARELFHYFKTYMNIFNSNELPEPLTIAKATAEASLQAALSEAQQQYTEIMVAACAEAAPRLPPATLRVRHGDARDVAFDLFRAKKKMGTQRQADTYLEHLSQDISIRLPYYEMINEEKKQRAVTNARQSYENSLQEVVVDGHVCIHPRDLDAVHQRAVAAATSALNENRILPEGEDTEENELMQVINQRLSELISLNESSNNAAVSASREAYVTAMKTACGLRPCMNTRQMLLKHADAFTTAIQLFSSRRTRNNEYTDDAFLSLLQEDIDEHFSDLRKINENSNRDAVGEAITCYNNIMASLFQSESICLHPEALSEEDEDARGSAFNEFHSKRMFGDNDEEDDHKRRLSETLSNRYEELREMNEQKNEEAVNAAKQEYSRAMEESCQRGMSRLADDQFENLHTWSNSAALTIFSDRRRPSPSIYDNDIYRNRLYEDLETLLMEYRSVNRCNDTPWETVMSVITPVAMAAGAAAAVVGTGGGAAMASAAGVTAMTVWARAMNLLRRRRLGQDT